MIIIISVMTAGFFLVLSMYIKKCVDETNFKKYLSVKEFMKDSCEEAEGIITGSLEKKIYVLKLVKNHCSTLKIKYDEELWATEIDAYIEKINKFKNIKK